jgi:XTP/dITP diphosphohydrolase
VASATAAKLPALADDSGLCIPALDGKPGIHSARWGGPEKDFIKACEKIKSELEAKGLDPAVPAYFICVLSLAQPDGSSVEFEGRVDGVLTFPPRGAEGFGYDPIFVPSHSTKTFGEMSQQEKNSKNHRADAFDKFKKYLLKHAA